MQNQLLLEYKEKKDVINFYESQIKTYDILDGFSYWEILYSEYKEWIKKNLHDILSNVAEFGCGTGILTSMLERKSERVLGIDICGKFLKKASKLQHESLFSTMQGDIKSVPIRDETMNAVVCLNTFDHVNNPKKVISEASRVCKRNDGIFLLDITSSMAMEPYYRLHSKKSGLENQKQKNLSEGTVPFEWSINADDAKRLKINTYRHSPIHIESLLKSGGFEIINKRGVHISTSLIPEFIQVNSSSRLLSLVNGALRMVDGFLNKIPSLKNYSMYVMYACKRVS